MTKQTRMTKILFYLTFQKTEQKHEGNAWFAKLQRTFDIELINVGSCTCSKTENMQREYGASYYVREYRKAFRGNYCTEVRCFR